MTLHELVHIYQSSKAKQETGPDLFFLHLLITLSFIRYIPKRYISMRVTIIDPIKFSTPNLNDVGQPLKQDRLDVLIQLGYPVIQICITFQIQTIDL